jgi:hypothetical protein
MKKVDWLGLALAALLCLATLYIVSSIPTYPIVKEGFLASAGSGVMTPPSRIRCSKTTLNTVATPSLLQSGGNTWLCADQTNANQLIAGDTTLKMAYISRNDAICISQDEDGTIYTCMDSRLDLEEDMSTENEFDNYITACNAYYVKYIDISNALTTLKLMQDTISNNNASLESSKAILNTMYTSYKCDNASSFTDGQKKVCNAVEQTRASIANDATQSKSLGDILMTSIKPALDSRAGLIRTLREYRCEFDLPVI